jgi:electron transport complex protein RnfG
LREYIRLGGTLCIIAAVATLLLAVAEHVTSERIAAIALAAEIKAMQDVLLGVDGVDEDTATVMPQEDDSIVSSITRFESNEGYVYAVNVNPVGYGGPIEIMVGVNSNLEVIGVSVIDSSGETPGLGSRVAEAEYTDKFIGKKKGVAVVKRDAGENQVVALTGATISSKAVGKGIKKAIEAAEEAMTIEKN